MLNLSGGKYNTLVTGDGSISVYIELIAAIDFVKYQTLKQHVIVNFKFLDMRPQYHTGGCNPYTIVLNTSLGQRRVTIK